MWSAGEIGLVMVLCESTAPAGYSAAPHQTLAYPQDVMKSGVAMPAPSPHTTAASVANFTPVGQWVGNYTCSQGYTGATLQIDRLDGEDFTGTFRFYPTPHNQYAAAGRYAVYGQYDRESQRILINPGKWLERPKDYYNTIIVGGFDPVNRTFSAYFQGVNGCTSFEAKYVEPASTVTATKAKKATKPSKAKSHKAKKAPAKTSAKSAASEATSMIVSPPPAAATSAATAAPMALAPIAPASTAATAPVIPAPAAVTVPSAAIPPKTPTALSVGDSIPEAPKDLPKDMVPPPANMPTATVPASDAQALPVLPPITK
jgi:hypothetical protein